MDKEIIHKEIDLIQACISRMANNSFLLKGWAITIIAVGLALTDKAPDQAAISTIVLIPLFCFWFLDAFFLRTEKMYREMYKWVLEKRSEDDKTLLYDLNPTRFNDQVDPLWKVMVSITLRWFYGIPTLITVGLIVTRFVRSCLIE
ncbi:MAG TPA: hypothetical protein PK802_07760 [Candidatus Cloacimonadota bacterium]|nr:hypothetical protein [Candidatus Cloacimonadota bacterium]